MLFSPVSKAVEKGQVVIDGLSKGEISEKEIDAVVGAAGDLGLNEVDEGRNYDQKAWIPVLTIALI